MEKIPQKGKKMENITNEPLLTESEAADFLGVSVRSLQNWRALGKAPKFYKYGYKGVRYRLAELIKWLESRTFNQDGDNL